MANRIKTSRASIYRVIDKEGKPIRREGVELVEYTYRDSDGKQCWRRALGIKQAEAELGAIKDKKRRGKIVRPMPRRTFSEAASLWKQELKQAEAQGTIRPKTVETYESAEKHLLKAWGAWKLGEIDKQEVARYVRDKRETLSAWTVKGHLTVAGQIFDAAREDGWTGDNPVRELGRKQRPKTEDTADKRTLTQKESERLLEATDKKYSLIFKLMLGTGARLSEALGLTWREVDTERKQIRFSHQVNRQGKRVELKTERSKRTIEIDSELCEGLRGHRLASDYSKPQDFVFASKSGSAHDQRNIGGRVLSRAKERAGLGEDVTSHCFRHTHISRLIASGQWDLASVSARAGHASAGFTANQYLWLWDAQGRSDERQASLDTLYGSGRKQDGNKISELRNSESSSNQEADSNVVELPALASGK